ncbi:MAG: hypothetical protein IMF09_08540 [Proteobacteria bacterium]|nr:hypothetical protein [Pseudomonadota bacterium]
MNFDTLKIRHRDIRDSLPESISVRIHRALSWLQRAEKETDDEDARFIFLWIAFNAAYASEVHVSQNNRERSVQLHFIERLLSADKQDRLEHIVWEEFSGSIRLLINNKYVFQPFWDYQRGDISEDEWQEAFQKNKKYAMLAIGNNDTKNVLAVVLQRLYILRNQLLHGLATWNSAVNRDQIRDGANILGRLVPAIIYLMLESGNNYWGDAAFPVVE